MVWARRAVTSAMFVAVATVWQTSPSLDFGVIDGVGADLMVLLYLGVLAWVTWDDRASIFGRSVHEFGVGLAWAYAVARITGLGHFFVDNPLGLERDVYVGAIFTEFALGVAISHFHRCRVLGTIDPHSEI